MKMLIGLGLAVVLALVVVLALRLRLSRRPPAPATIAPTAAPQNAGDQEKPEVLPAGLATTTPQSPTPGSVEATQEEVKNLARLFAERYGSYGPETNFGNFADVKLMVTASMAAYFDSLIAKGSSPSDKTVVTRAISAEIREWSDARAVVGVTTQREETTGGAQNVTYQPLRVRLLKVNGEWKVDGAWWE